MYRTTYLARLKSLHDEFHAGQNKQLADDDPQKLAQAAVMSRIRTLLVDPSQHRPGRIDVATGAMQFADTTDEGDCVYDDLAELVLRRGGEVIVVPADRMPTRSAVAGIYRF